MFEKPVAQKEMSNFAVCNYIILIQKSPEGTYYNVSVVKVRMVK